MKEKQKKRSFNGFKIFTICLAVILVAMIGFFGLYVKKQNRMEDVMKKYSKAMDLKGGRVITVKPTQVKEEIIKDKDGNVINDKLTDEEIKEKGYSKEEVDKTLENVNYENIVKAKKIIEKRLNEMNVSNYVIKANEKNGEITVELEEDENTDEIVSNFWSSGKFEITDSETQESLMDNNDINKVDVMYNNSEAGTSVYMDIVLTKDGKEKLKNISTTYKTLEKEEKPEEKAEEEPEEKAEEKVEEKPEEKQKKVTLKIDNQEIMTTSFDEVIEMVKLQLSVGKPAKSNKEINENARRAGRMATILQNGRLPFEYEISENEFVKSEIEKDEINNIILVFGIISIIFIVILIVKHKKIGALAGISYIGLAGLFLIVLRYTNVIISLNGIFAIGMVLFLNYIFLMQILKQKEIKEIGKVYKKYFLTIMPVVIMAIVLAFINWLPISSFGMTMFWGIVLIAIYNLCVTVPMLKMNEKK